MFNNITLGNNIRKYREAKTISQSELAERLFVTPQAISKWERGIATPEIDKLCKLAELFDTSLDSIVGYVHNEEIVMIGIDGGGTKTEYILFNNHGKIYERIVSDGTNPNLYGTEKICTLLKTNIKALLAIKPDVKAIHAGVSGFLSGNQGEVVKKYLKSAFPAIKIHCTGDMINIISGATDEKNCLGSISGTGNISFAYKDGSITKYGGYGALFDKSGSGYDIGRDAIYYALEENDNLGEATMITQLIENRLGDTISRKITELYRADTAYIASFSMEVFEAAKTGDRIANEIVNNNAERAAYVINTAFRHNPECRTLILAGSLYKNESFVAKVQSMLDRRLVTVIPQNPPVYGACVQCCRMLNITTEELEANFVSEYEKCQ